jgi:two-component system cell cycle sensor histidine kinase/response regulator CckA
MGGFMLPEDSGSRKLLRVLIAEDNAADAELCLRELEKAGYSTEADLVTTPDEFDDAIRTRSYDVVLCDHNLREGTGRDALRRLKASDQDIPFILVTGALEDVSAVACIQEGASDYVLKDGLPRLPIAVHGALLQKRLRDDHRRALQALQASERRYRLLFERNLAGVYRITLDGRILDLNEAGARMFGYASPEEAKEHPLWEISSSPQELQDLILRVFQMKTLTNVEVKLRKRDGRPVWVLFNASLIESEHGPAPTIEGTLIDITDRKDAEEALRRNEKRFRELIENSSDAISLIDERGRVLFSSHAVSPILGYDVEERLGRDVFELMHPEDMATTKSAFQKLLDRPDQTVNIQVRYRHKDGSWRWLEALGKNLLQEPSVRALVVNYRDITERKSLQEQFYQSQKMEAVGRLAGGVAHDFNNLLTAIIGYSDIALEQLPLQSETRHAIQEIKKSGERAALLTRQLLAFSRQQVLSPQLLDLNQVVLEVSHLLRRLIGEDIELVTVPRLPLGRVKADPTQLEQVLMNLAVNARDAMPQGGRLTIEVSNTQVEDNLLSETVKVRPGPYILLTVSDTGCGMDAETRARAFDPFFTTKEKGKGTGLGLATVYGIVKQSGGYIWVYSEAGQGTTFKIYLPQVDAVPEPARPPEALSTPRHGTETVLLVEDNPSVRQLTTKLLKAKGYRVLEANNGNEALHLAEQHSGMVDLLLTDLVMPHLNGRELAKQLTSRHPEIRVLFMSGYSGAPPGDATSLDPYTAFIQKPFNADQLARRVREVLDNVPPSAPSLLNSITGPA